VAVLLSNVCVCVDSRAGFVCVCVCVQAARFHLGDETETSELLNEVTVHDADHADIGSTTAATTISRTSCLYPTNPSAATGDITAEDLPSDCLLSDASVASPHLYSNVTTNGVPVPLQVDKWDANKVKVDAATEPDSISHTLNSNPDGKSNGQCNSSVECASSAAANAMILPQLPQLSSDDDKSPIPGQRAVPIATVAPVRRVGPQYAVFHVPLLNENPDGYVDKRFFESQVM
jgi:hypothetical protein